jgi:hypothetical protein
MTMSENVAVSIKFLTCVAVLSPYLPVAAFVTSVMGTV